MTDDLRAKLEAAQRELEKRESTCGECGAYAVWKLGPLADEIRDLRVKLGTAEARLLIARDDSAALRAELEELRVAALKARSVIDSFMGDSDLEGDHSPEMDAMQHLNAALNHRAGALRAGRSPGGNP